MRIVGLAALAMVGCAVVPGAVSAAPMEYVRVCDAFGAGFLYIPGTETCLNPNNGQTRQVVEPGVTKPGQSELSSRVSDTEGGLAETNEQLANTNSQLSNTNSQLSKTNKRVDALEQAHADLEQRFENAFEESLDGVAIAMALSGPDMVGGERFAVKVNFGTYNGANAFGFTMAGVLARTDFGRITMSGGVATTGQNTGGNVGMQLSW